MRRAVLISGLALAALVGGTIVWDRVRLQPSELHPCAAPQADIERLEKDITTYSGLFLGCENGCAERRAEHLLTPEERERVHRRVFATQEAAGHADIPLAAPPGCPDLHARAALLQRDEDTLRGLALSCLSACTEKRDR